MWYSYAQLEYRLGHYAKLEALFARCLKTVCDVRLWRVYTAYVRQSKSAKATEERMDDEVLTARAAIMKAFEVAVSTVGMDVDALPLWEDYLAFVRTIPVGRAHCSDRV